MDVRTRIAIAALAGAAGMTLAGCASDPYYNGYYDNSVGYGPGYGYGYDYPYYSGPVVGGVVTSDRYYYRDGDRRHWRSRDRDDRRIESMPTPSDLSNPIDAQNFENRERLLRGQQPSGAGG